LAISKNAKNTSLKISMFRQYSMILFGVTRRGLVDWNRNIHSRAVETAIEFQAPAPAPSI